MSEIVLQGPFLTRSQAARRSGAKKAELPDRPDLLHIGGRWTEEVYFAFQFDHHGIRPDIGRVVTALKGRWEDEVIADWLVRPNTKLVGATPLAVFNGPHGLDRVLHAIASDVSPVGDVGAGDGLDPTPVAAGPPEIRPGRRGRATPRRRTAFPHPA